jgi:hypothetical protein
MNRWAIDQLRDVNPHPRTLPAPPIQTVLDRLEERSGPGAGGSRSRRRPAGALAFPLLTSVVAIGVLVIVLISVHTGHARHNAGPNGLGAAGHPTHVTPSGSLAAPRHGMRGSVYSFNATALAPNGGGIVSLQQCLGCKSDGNQTPNSQTFDWLLSTNRAGMGTLVRTRYQLVYPQLSGPNGWASGTQSNGHGTGGTAEFYVSRDAGRHWSVAPSAAPNYGDAQLSLGFGEVWSVGQPGTATVVLHAPAAGSRLLATAVQPTHGMWPNAQVAAAGPGTAYLYNGDAPGQMYLTRDDGHSWQHGARPCPARSLGKLTNVAFGNSVWVVCDRIPPRSAPRPRNAHLVLSRSTDGGQRWTDLPTPFNAGYSPILSPVSASVLWAQASGGVLRSTNGGMTWRTVWSFVHSQVPGLRGSYLPGTYPGDVIAQGPETATVQVSLLHGRPGSAGAYTNLVRYRTNDGGRTWKAKVVSLAVG